MRIEVDRCTCGHAHLAGSTCHCGCTAHTPETDGPETETSGKWAVRKQKKGSSPWAIYRPGAIAPSSFYRTWGQAMAVVNRLIHFETTRLEDLR